MEFWKSEHRSLYREDGTPTNELRRLRKKEREQKPEPQSSDPTDPFPVVRVSSGVDAKIKRLITAASIMARNEPEGSQQDHKTRVLYAVLHDTMRDLYRYVEALEHEAGIPRTITKRF